MLELLFLVLGVAVGYNIRRDRETHQENLVLEKVDARLRQELAVANNLNQSLLQDLAQLKRTPPRAASNTAATAAPATERRAAAQELVPALGN